MLHEGINPFWVSPEQEFFFVLTNMEKLSAFSIQYNKPALKPSSLKI